MSRLRVALVQLAADHDVTANIDRAASLVRQAGEPLHRGGIGGDHIGCGDQPDRDAAVASLQTATDLLK